jgi:hypothetical protein
MDLPDIYTHAFVGSLAQVGALSLINQIIAIENDLKACNG